MSTREEMATEVVKAWIGSKAGSADHVGSELKIIYKAMIESYSEANKKTDN